MHTTLASLDISLNRFAWVLASAASALSPASHAALVDAPKPALSDRFFYRAANMGTDIRLIMEETGDAVVDRHTPRTELGRKLLALRRAFVLGGGELLDGDALDREMRMRRGGVVDG